jgi:hypothetical protein
MSINSEFLQNETKKNTESGYIEQEAPKINIFGTKFDKVGLIINIIALILWILIWKITGLFNVKCSVLLFFFFFVIILRLLFLWLERDEKIAYISEEEGFYKSIKEKSLVVFGATLLLLIVVLYFNNFKINKENISNYLVLAIANICILLSIVSLSVPNRASNFRTIRILNGMLYNTGCFLIIAYLIKLYCEKVN